MLDSSTNLVIQGQHDSDTGWFLTTEEMIASHQHYVPINKQKRKEENFCKSFFELNKESCMNEFLENIQQLNTRKAEQLSIQWDNKTIKKKAYSKQKKLVDDILHMQTHLTNNDDIEYLDE